MSVNENTLRAALCRVLELAEHSCNELDHEAKQAGAEASVQKHSIAINARIARIIVLEHLDTLIAAPVLLATLQNIASNVPAGDVPPKEDWHWMAWFAGQVARAAIAQAARGAE